MAALYLQRTRSHSYHFLDVRFDTFAQGIEASFRRLAELRMSPDRAAIS